MMRSVILAIPLAVLLWAGLTAAEGEQVVKAASAAVADEATRGAPQGHSQQYHYNSYPSHGGGHDPYGYTYAGLSFDLSTGLFLALGAIIVLLALGAVVYPMMSKGSSSGYDDSSSYGSYGTTSGGGGYGSYRSYNLAGTAEKVLSAVEKVYEAYNSNNNKAQ